MKRSEQNPADRVLPVDEKDEAPAGDRREQWETPRLLIEDVTTSTFGAGLLRRADVGTYYS